MSWQRIFDSLGLLIVLVAVASSVAALLGAGAAFTLTAGSASALLFLAMMVVWIVKL